MGDDLNLEHPDPPPGSGEKVARSRTAYAKRLEDYVTTYQRSVRLLKGWINTGREAVPPELPPLDEPAKMLGWWERHKKNRPPDILLALAAEAKKPVTPTPVVSSPSFTPAPTPAAAESKPTGPLFEAAASPPSSVTAAAPVEAAGVPSLILDAKRFGYSAFLQRLRVAEANSGQLYESILAAAIKETDPDTKIRLQASADQAYRAWTGNSSEYRKAEADAPKILAAAGKAWDSDAVLASMEAVQLIQKSGVTRLVERIRPLLKACRTPAEEDDLWRRETDKIFAQWNATQFTAIVGGKDAA